MYPDNGLGGELKAILAYLCSIFAVPNLQGSRVFFAAINLPFTPLIFHSAAWGLWVTSCSDISAGLNHAAEGHIPQPRQAPSSCGWGRDLPLRPADTRTGEAVWPRPAVLHLPAPHALLPQLASLLRLLQVVQGYAPPCRHIWRLLLQRYCTRVSRLTAAVPVSDNTPASNLTGEQSSDITPAEATPLTLSNYFSSAGANSDSEADDLYAQAWLLSLQFSFMHLLVTRKKYTELMPTW